MERKWFQEVKIAWLEFGKINKIFITNFIMNKNLNFYLNLLKISPKKLSIILTILYLRYLNDI